MAADDALLLARIATGDEDALRELHRLYRSPLRRYLWHRLGGDPRMVEETLQDVFLAVWRGAPGYRGDAKAATWIFQIARYLAIRVRRNESRHAGAVPLDPPDTEDASQPDWLSISCEDEVLDRLALAESLERLSAKHREVLELVFHYGFSLDEVARILDVPTGTVKSRVSYARRALLQVLASAPTKETPS